MTFKYKSISSVSHEILKTFIRLLKKFPGEFISVSRVYQIFFNIFQTISVL